MSLIKKKVIIYSIIIVGLIIITLFTSHITGVATDNTWLGLLFGNSFGLTTCIAFYDISRIYKGTKSLSGCFFYFIVGLIIVVLIVNNIAFFIGAFNG